jgi:hypothetical protein
METRGTAQSNGSIRSIRRLKSGLSGRQMRSAEQRLVQLAGARRAKHVGSSVVFVVTLACALKFGQPKVCYNLINI